jgi:D-alanyl-D-alanine dipeptidase
MNIMKKLITTIFLIVALAMLVSCAEKRADKTDTTPTNGIDILATLDATPEATPKLTLTSPSTSASSPTPEPTPIAYVDLSDDSALLSVRRGPGTNTERLGMLNNGDPVNILEQGDVWYKIDFNGAEGYVFAEYITGVSVQYAYVPILEATVDGQTYISSMVDIRAIIPDIKIWLTFASQDNVMGKVLYPAGACLLQESTAQKLLKAAEIFAKDGYRIRIYDAYRPYSVSVYLYEEIQDKRFVANPSTKPSDHNKGAAVDITLEGIDTGNQIDMPSQMHTFNITSFRNFPDISLYTVGSAEYNAFLQKYPDIFDYSKRTSTEISNMNYMTKVMKECGFTTISTEWWHFSDNEKAQFMVLDYDLASDVTWIPDDEYADFMATKALEKPVTDLPNYVVFPKSSQHNR